MADWPVCNSQVLRNYGISGLTSITLVGSSASTNTKGSWVELSSATAFDGTAILLQGIGIGAGYDYLADIGVGAAGSEIEIIKNILITESTNRVSTENIIIPIHIPKGSRLSARVQCSTGTQNFGITTIILSGLFTSFAPISYVDCLGANTADSGGLSIDPGGTVNTKGAWIQVSAAVPFNIKGLSIMIGNQLNATRQLTSWYIDVGVGNDGSEVVIVPDFYARCFATAYKIIPGWGPFIPVDIPKGARLAVRCQCNINDAADRLMDVVIAAGY